MLRRAPTLTEEVSSSHNCRSLHRPAEDAVEEGRAPAHAACAGYQRFEQAGESEETSREDGLAAVAREEPFDLLQTLWGEFHIPPPCCTITEANKPANTPIQEGARPCPGFE